MHKFADFGKGKVIGMEAYTDFASVYDKFMDETPYEQWCENILQVFHEYSITDGLILELGCGTGSMTELLAAKGYDMIGVDYSEDMLNIAQDKKMASGQDILYLNQDMRAFELYGTVRAVVSVCDSLNYLLEKEDIVTCFKLVNNYLDPKGIFFFDFNTAYKYEVVIGDTVIAENREDCSFIWENFYDPEEMLNEYDLTIFVREEQEDGQELFRKFEETHFQRGYTLEEMKSFIEEAGMVFLKAYDADTLQEVTMESERIYCVAQECGK